MTIGTESLYPEHDKMKLIADKSQAIGEFVEWLEDVKDIRLADYHGEYDRLEPSGIPIVKLLAEFFDIDLTAIDEEKAVMLQRLRDQNEAGRGPGS